MSPQLGVQQHVHSVAVQTAPIYCPQHDVHHPQPQKQQAQVLKLCWCVGRAPNPSSTISVLEG